MIRLRLPVIITRRLCCEFTAKMISYEYANLLKTFDYQSGRNEIEREAMDAVIQGNPLRPVFEAHNLSLEERKKLLDTKLGFPHKGEQCSLFLLAVVCGHVDLTNAILEEKLVDPDQKGTVLVTVYKDHDLELGTTAYEVGEDVTPLWCAAAWSKLEVAKVLVHHGADMNCLSKGGSSPLFMACQYFPERRHHRDVLGLPDAPLQLELAKYLIENGADVNAVARCGNTPLMAAAVSGYKDPSLVAYLLESGANPNARNGHGTTALHLAAESGCLETVKVLAKHGALPSGDKEGLTPLQRACCGCHDEIVEYLISLPECGREEKINALELLGASHATVTDIEDIDYPSEGASDEEESDDSSIQQGYQIMLRAMKERFGPPSDIVKGLLVKPPVAVYDNRAESQSIQDLEAISTDNEAICMEGFVVRERILGSLPSAVILKPLMEKAVYLAHNGNVERAMLFYNHALSFKLVPSLESEDILRRFLDLLVRMLGDKANVGVTDLEPAFEFIITRLGFVDQKRQKHQNDPNVSHFQLQESQWVFDFDFLKAFYFICILNNVAINNKEEADRKLAMIKEILNLNLRNSTGSEMIHLAVWDSLIEVHNKVLVAEIYKVPNQNVLEVLAQCGANVNVQDNCGNSPLHVLALIDTHLAIVPDDFKENKGKKCVDWFVENGAKLDLCNAADQTPADIAVSEITKGFLQIL